MHLIQVWKSRKLSYKGKTIIVKNLLLSYCGFEIEMKGIPDKFKKEIETLMWDFIWEEKVKYTICHSINNVLPNFIIVNIVTMMYPQSFYIFFNP
jgi:hypothetical protein